MPNIKCYANFIKAFETQRKCKECEYSEGCRYVTCKLFCKCCEKNLSTDDIFFLGTQNVPKSRNLHLYNCKTCGNTIALKEKLINLG
jgi:hypothetical protein